MLSWANRAFDLGFSRQQRAGAVCEVIPKGSGVEGLRRVDLDEPWSSAFQYYVFSVNDGKPTGTSVALQYIAFGDTLL